MSYKSLIILFLSPIQKEPFFKMGAIILESRHRDNAEKEKIISCHLQALFALQISIIAFG